MRTKSKTQTLAVDYKNDTPYFDESKIVLICRKVFAQELKEECFIDKSIIDKWYPQKDYHTMYARLKLKKFL